MKFGLYWQVLIFVTTGDNDWTNIMISGLRSSDSIIPGLVFFAIFYVGSDETYQYSWSFT
jgi:hypothetical protein